MFVWIVTNRIPSTHGSDAGLMLGQSLRRWPNIKPALDRVGPTHSNSNGRLYILAYMEYKSLVIKYSLDVFIFLTPHTE